MKRYVNIILPKNVKVQTAFTGKRLSSCFKTKDRTKFEHQHDIIYQVKCSAENCSDDYIGESARRILETILDNRDDYTGKSARRKGQKDHSGRDTKSHALKYSFEKEHAEVTQQDFKIISSNCKNIRLKRKIVEVLSIKQKCPSLNVQDQSVGLKLLN